MKNEKRQVTLTKGEEKFIFRYEHGQEYEFLDALAEQAQDRRTSFDWFDAGVLSIILTQSSIIDRIDELLNS